MEFEDIYGETESVLALNFNYITENIPFKETESIFLENFTSGCNCEFFCNLTSKCSCLRNELNYIKTNEINNLNETKNVLHKTYLLNEAKLNYGMYECNENCKCFNKTCGNRLVQFGPKSNLEIRECEEKGQGLFTKERIVKGQFICEYAGEIITKPEALKRFQNNKEKNLMNYIICVKEHFGEKQISTFIDPFYFGNIGRYINHSCDPNCVIIPVRVNNNVPKLSIFARKDIEENNELSFNYGDEDKKMLFSDNLELKPCLCKAINCKKWLPYDSNV